MSRQGWGGGVALHRVTIMSPCPDHSATTGHLGYEEEGVHPRACACHREHSGPPQTRAQDPTDLLSANHVHPTCKIKKLGPWPWRGRSEAYSRWGSAPPQKPS